MVRVLHLLSTTPDFPTERTAAAIRRHAGSEFSITTRTIGRGGDYRNWPFGFFSLNGRKVAQFDVIHAFDFDALQASARTGRAVYSPQCVSQPSVGWIRPHMPDVPVHVVCASESERRIYASFGIPAEHCHVAHPPVEFSHLAKGRDLALRAALGFAPDDCVFLLPGESDRQSEHHDALWTIAVLRVLHPSFHVLAWGRGSGVDALRRLANNFYHPEMLTVAETKLGRRVDFEELLGAADMAVFPPRGPTPLLPLALCMSAGLPIVSTASPWLGDILQDGGNAALVQRLKPRALAQRIMDLREDPRLAASLGAAARRQAKKFFRAAQIVPTYLSFYRNIASKERSIA